jgi:polysaccharide biosynthesis protein PelG
LMLAGFVILCCIWTATIFLSGMKRYLEIFGIYLIGYAITVASALTLRPLGLEGLLFGFVIGHFVLLTGMVTLTLREYPSERFISFEFLHKRAMYPALIGCGFLYHLAVWVDKLMFWYYPETSIQVIGPLRASLIYDLPIFLAYLAIIPGMAVFLVEIETQFAEAFQKFYDAVREGATLNRIESLRDEMVHTIRNGLFEIVKIQSIAALVIFVIGPWLLDKMGISDIYLPLLYVDVVAASLQVLLLGVLTIFYYLDKRKVVLALCGLCLFLNVALTGLTLILGAPFYGYGFAVALLVTIVVAMMFMERKLATLEYETFMLQKT